MTVFFGAENNIKNYASRLINHDSPQFTTVFSHFDVE